MVDELNSSHTVPKPNRFTKLQTRSGGLSTTFLAIERSCVRLLGKPVHKHWANNKLQSLGELFLSRNCEHGWLVFVLWWKIGH